MNHDDNDWAYDVYGTSYTKTLQVKEGKEPIPYKIYVPVYIWDLKAGDTTEAILNSVTMNSGITSQDIAVWDEKYGEGEWAKVYIFVEALQADGVSSVIGTMNEVFGRPSSYTPDFLGTQNASGTNP